MKIFKELIPSITKSKSLRKKNLKELTNGKMADVPIVVSLTSYGSRLEKADIAVRSLLDQIYSPEKIVLNLHESYQNKIPKNLKDLIGNEFEINFMKEDCPHMKLLPTLKKYTNFPVLTIDDDVLYPRNFIEKFYFHGQVAQDKIIANHVRIISHDKLGNLLPYKSWTFDGVDKNPLRYLALGFGGVLYPANVFDEEAFNKDVYLKLAPKADDLWFKAMAIKQGIDVIPLRDKPDSLYPIMGNQEKALKTKNVDEDHNRVVWGNLESYYNLNL